MNVPTLDLGGSDEVLDARKVTVILGDLVRITLTTYSLGCSFNKAENPWIF